MCYLNYHIACRFKNGKLNTGSILAVFAKLLHIIYHGNAIFGTLFIQINYKHEYSNNAFSEELYFLN